MPRTLPLLHERLLKLLNSFEEERDRDIAIYSLANSAGTNEFSILEPLKELAAKRLIVLTDAYFQDGPTTLITLTSRGLKFLQQLDLEERTRQQDPENTYARDVIEALSDGCRQLLEQVVQVFVSGCRTQFTLADRTLVYECHEPISTSAGHLDFERLSERELLSISIDSKGQILGKPTAKAIRVVMAYQQYALGAAEVEDDVKLSEANPELPHANRRLRVFLCHSSSDKPAVRTLYQLLRSTKHIDPWLDEEALLPGTEWESEITRAVRESDIVVVCLSASSVSKNGFVNKEIKHALDVADEKAEGSVFIIPAKIEPCDVPLRLRRWQWVDLFTEGGYERLLRALDAAAQRIVNTSDHSTDSNTG